MRAEGFLVNYPLTVIAASIQRGEVQKLRRPLQVHILLTSACLLFFFVFIVIAIIIISSNTLT